VRPDGRPVARYAASADASGITAAVTAAARRLTIGSVVRAA
jgi:hypothetical protein